jgi:hypothetical protein
MKNLSVLLVMVGLLLLTEGQTIAQTNIWEKSLNYISLNSICSFTMTKNNSAIINSSNINSGAGIITNLDSRGNSAWQAQTITASWSMINYGDSILTINSRYSMAVIDYAGNIIRIIPLPEMTVATYGIAYICPDKISGEYYIMGIDTNHINWMTFVYDKDFNFIRSFQITDGKPLELVSCGVFQNGYLYVARSKYGGGDHSNLSADIYKYDAFGHLLWTKTLADRYNPFIVATPDEGVYCATTNLGSHDTTSVIWEVIKIAPDSNIVWDKFYVGSFNYPTSHFVYGIAPTPMGGCLVYGEDNKPGKPYDGWCDPLAIGYSADGDSVFSVRNSESIISQQGAVSYFAGAAWDNNKALVMTGFVDRVAKIWKYSIDGVTAVKKENPDVPSSFSLSQNYPNPFNPSTTINFSVVKSGLVSLKVYDLLGREVSTLINEEVKTGNYSVKFDGSKLASGVYVYVLKTADFTSSKKMLLVK